MKNKISLLGMLALALAFGLVFSGCAMLGNAITGTKEVETETSTKLKSAANDLILAKGDGIVPQSFKAAFEQKFPGLKILSSMEGMGSLDTTIDFTYQDKKYRMGFTGKLPADVTTHWTHITSATSCKELQKKAVE
jgi:hypothetical protein